MSSLSRRDLLGQAVTGLAALGASGLVLRADAKPTESSGHDEPAIHHGYDAAPPSTPAPHIEPEPPTHFEVTEDNILGPYFRPGAPYRGKVTAPAEPGTVLVILGRVWGYDTKRPLRGVHLDIWQANARGRYDNDDPAHPVAAGVFRNRIRLVTDETGYYEYETVHPGRYKTSPDTWRPSHIHYRIAAAGYQTLVTQLYFEGDPYNESDLYIKDSLIIDVKTITRNSEMHERGTFDIVLAPA